MNGCRALAPTGSTIAWLVATPRPTAPHPRLAHPYFVRGVSHALAWRPGIRNGLIRWRSVAWWRKDQPAWARDLAHRSKAYSLKSQPTHRAVEPANACAGPIRRTRGQGFRGISPFPPCISVSLAVARRCASGNCQDSHAHRPSGFWQMPPRVDRCPLDTKSHTRIFHAADLHQWHPAFLARRLTPSGRGGTRRRLPDWHPNARGRPDPVHPDGTGA